jgi:hypothetical protein
LLEGDNQALARGNANQEVGHSPSAADGSPNGTKTMSMVAGPSRAISKTKNPEVLELYKRFVELVRECGPFEYAPVRSQIGFRVKRIFARVKLAEKNLEGYLDIDRAIRDPRFHHIAPYQTNLFVHHFRIASET